MNHRPFPYKNGVISFGAICSRLIRLTLPVIEFLSPRLYVDVGVGQLTEIDFRADYGDALHVLSMGRILRIRAGSPSGVNPFTEFMVIPYPWV